MNSVWQSSADAMSMAERGHAFIHQPSDYFYLVSTRFATSCYPSFSKLSRIVELENGWGMIFKGEFHIS